MLFFLALLVVLLLIWKLCTVQSVAKKTKSRVERGQTVAHSSNDYLAKACGGALRRGSAGRGSAGHGTRASETLAAETTHTPPRHVQSAPASTTRLLHVPSAQSPAQSRMLTLPAKNPSPFFVVEERPRNANAQHADPVPKQTPVNHHAYGAVDTSLGLSPDSFCANENRKRRPDTQITLPSPRLASRHPVVKRSREANWLSPLQKRKYERPESLFEPLKLLRGDRSIAPVLLDHTLYSIAVCRKPLPRATQEITNHSAPASITLPTTGSGKGEEEIKSSNPGMHSSLY